MIRQALDGKIGDKKEDKDEFLREFCKLRARHEELLNQSIQARRSLKQVRLEVRLACFECVKNAIYGKYYSDPYYVFFGYELKCEKNVSGISGQF